MLGVFILKFDIDMKKNHRYGDEVIDAIIFGSITSV